MKYTGTILFFLQIPDECYRRQSTKLNIVIFLKISCNTRDIQNKLDAIMNGESVQLIV